jgi:hypothetical protein
MPRENVLLWGGAPESLAKHPAMHPKGDLVWREDSVGVTPTDAVETTALPRKPPMIGGSKESRKKRLQVLGRRLSLKARRFSGCNILWAESLAPVIALAEFA